MRKLFLCTIIFIGVLFPLLAVDTAIITETTGKVEIQAPGKGWTAAGPGTHITKGTTISTGFNSGATIDLGSSEIQVRQLTRMELGELIQQQGTITTDLTLKVGKIRAEIKPVEGLEHDFKIRSAVSTASVRGTILEDEDGEEYSSDDGSFVVETLLKQTVTVSKNESAQVAPPEEGGAIVPPVVVLTTESEVVPDTTSLPEGADGDDDGGGDDTPDIPADPDPDPTTTTVTVTWN